MKNFHADIRIMLRKSILDVQGKTVEQSLHAIGYEGISNLHIGKNVELTVSAENLEQAQAIVKEACEKLIANPVMEDFYISISEQ